MKGFGGSSSGFGTPTGFGCSSAGYGPPPMPAPTQPPPPASSTLSPLAPPFTVDRAFSMTYHPSSSPMPDVSLDAYCPIAAPDNWLSLNPPNSTPAPPHPFPQVDSASDPVRFYGPYPSPLSRSLSSSFVEAKPYFPYYSPPAVGVGSARARDEDQLRPFSDFGGYMEGHEGMCDRPFDLESGRATMGDDASLSWRGPNSPALDSSYNPLHQDVPGPACFGAFEDFSGVWRGEHLDPLTRNVQHAPESSVWVDDKPPAFHGDNAREPFNLTETSPLVPNSFAEGINYLHSADPVSSMRSLSTFNSSSSAYNKYIEQLDSCKMEPLIHHPATTYPSTAYAFASSDGRTSTITDVGVTKNVSSFSQHVDAYNNNVKYRGNASTRLKPSSNHFAEGKGGYSHKHTMSKGLRIGQSASANYYLGKMKSPPCVESATRISVKHPLEIKSEQKNANLNLSNPCNYALDSVEDGSRSPCEASDQLNLAVDSPCWKGASASRHSPFCAGETAVGNSVGANPEYKGASGLDGSTIGDEKGSHYADGLKEQNTTLKNLNDSKSSSELKDFDAVPIIQEGSGAYAPQPVSRNATVLPVTDPDKNGSLDLEFFDDILKVPSSGNVPSEIVHPFGAWDTSNTCSPGRIDNKLLVKMILNISEVLLSSYYGDANALKEHDCEILKLAVVNLEKIGLQRTNHETVPHHGSLRSTFCEVLEKVLMESFEEGGNSQAILYKNLWVEAEVAICALKYELELARMKIKQQQTKDTLLSSNSEGEPTTMAISSLNSMDNSDRFKVLPPIAKECSSEDVSTAGKAVSKDSCMKPEEAIHTHLNNKEGIDASVMTRLRVLKDRIDRENSVCMKEKQKLPELLDVGVNVGKKESVCHPFYSVSELDIGSKLQPISVDSTSAIWRTARVSNVEALEHQGFGAKSKTQHLFPNYYEGIGLESDISGERRGSREFLTLSEDGSVNRLYISSNRSGKRFLGGGAESPSSDWEHVLKEEVTWQPLVGN